MTPILLAHALPSDRPEGAAVLRAAEAAIRAVPPAWPLSATVAVNPFLGQAAEPLALAAARLARAAGAPATLPRRHYAARIAAGEIAEDDLLAALAAAPPAGRPADLAALRAALDRPAPEAPGAVPTLADLAAAATGTDWPRLVEERIGAWAAAHFDQGQALWGAPRGGAFATWRAWAIRDLIPEIAGLGGFARHVAAAPETAEGAIARATGALGLAREALEPCFHRLLMSLGGWSQYARYLLWQAELAGGSDATARDLLAIRLLWEEALLAAFGDRLASPWAAARARHAEPLAPSLDQAIDAILQEAAERAHQRRLAAVLAAPATAAPDGPEGRPDLQAAFCIDVRSEVFRRALESVSPGTRTLGFAGFFGLRAAHRRFASDVEELRLPVLLTPTAATGSTAPEARAADLAARLRARAGRAWGRFKLAAVSSFAFVESAGPLYAGKLLRDAFGLYRQPAPQDPPPRFEPALSDADRLDAAEAVLRAMSLTAGFARLVLLAGHGATVANNPHASALHCGACGGYSGEANARLLAGLLNDPLVRAGLASRGIAAPADTLFLGALHDTTTDTVAIYAADHPAADHAEDLARARRWLSEAGALARAERALRLPRARGQADLAARARDWSEIRPEWGLAGCAAFVAAPRARSRGRDLGGRAFLHDYVWSEDRGFATLELILTAPVVVASWISLQYYGSAIAPAVFGGGDKLLHNVTGGIGVVEGNGGALRIGLPWQSVHDGERLQHEPLRLSVCIEAPREAMADILRRHEGVRALFDNRWLHLLAIDGDGRLAWRYEPGLAWSPAAFAGPARAVA